MLAAVALAAPACVREIESRPYPGTEGAEKSPATVDPGGTLPQALLALTAAEVAVIADLALEHSVSGAQLRAQGALAAKASGVEAALPDTLAGLAVEPFGTRPQDVQVDFRFLALDGDELTLQVHARNPIGGPSIYDLRFVRGADGWQFGRVLRAVEFL
ncbi:MAG TPA: hypothetical protein VGC54_13165 [Planctomycetota bacterium]